MTFTPLASATSAMKTTSRPISFGQGSTKVPSPRSLSSLSRSTASLSAVLRSNRGALQSSSHPAHPTSRCSCIRVVPSLSVLIVPVTVLIVFMLALLGLRRRADVSRTHIERSNPPLVGRRTMYDRRPSMVRRHRTPSTPLSDLGESLESQFCQHL